MSTARFNDPKAPAAALHRLTNGRYELLISDSGAGQSSCNGIALNRWRNDPIQDDLGSIVYLRDLDTGRYWSLGYQPTRTSTGRYRAGLDGERFAVEREDEGIEARLAVSIDAHADLERRRVRLRNLSARARRVELTSYLEVVLFPADADAAHPAFAKLFVQTERDPASGALLARRRPRAQHEAWPWMVHALAGAEPVQWESDRARFLGRGRTPASPAALLGDAPLSGTVGNVLDPVLSLRTVVELAPGEEVETLFLTGVAPDRAGALRLVEPDIRLMRAGGRRACSPAVSPGGSSPADAEDGAAVDGLLFFNGYGGFSADGTEYVIRLPWGRDAPRRPPQPWINVIANERCGLLVSESGAGYTWARNSQANRLTPWDNDPVSDPHGESCYIRDEDSGAAWSPTPGPMPAPCDYEVRHGLGYSRFTCDYSGLTQEIDAVRSARRPSPDPAPETDQQGRGTAHAVRVFVPAPGPGWAARVSPSPVVTAFDAGRDLLTAVNPEAGDFAGGIAFAFSVVGDVAGVEVEGSAFSGDRLAFIGRHGDPSSPAALRPGAELDAACGRGLEPCFAQQVRIRLASGETAECAFLLGECLGEAELDELVGRYRVPGAVGAALAEATGFWADLVSRTRVETPSPAIDLMFNGWLQYQNLGCRIWARSAFYQSGGAYGYRDQLQDAAALVYLRPDLTRAQILLHAGNQFVEGDVLHWWHPAPMGRGLRTRFSDDLLWLPFVTGHYVQVTGDEALLEEPAPFLAARTLAPGEDEAYLLPEPSGESADVYEHCCRAIDRSLTRGAHGLPLMGTGDWNDGMNRVGREGRGESVWLGFFLFQILGDFIPLCERREDARPGRALRRVPGEPGRRPFRTQAGTGPGTAGPITTTARRWVAMATPSAASTPWPSPGP